MVFFEKTVKRSQATEEEGVHKGRKQWRKLFVCHKEQIKIWVRMRNRLSYKKLALWDGLWWFYTARIHIHIFSSVLKHVCDRWVTFCSIIPESSVKFPMTRNLWSYPLINHWWPVIFDTLDRFFLTRELDKLSPPTDIRLRTSISWHKLREKGRNL